jgi:hypothetical protein
VVARPRPERPTAGPAAAAEPTPPAHASVAAKATVTPAAATPPVPVLEVVGTEASVGAATGAVEVEEPAPARAPVRPPARPRRTRPRVEIQDGALDPYGDP